MSDVNNLSGRVTALPQLDSTLTKAGFCADAKAAGDAIAHYKEEINGDVDKKLSEVDEKLSAATTEINTNIEAFEKQITDDFAENISTLDARITNLATLEEGSTTGDAELADIRVGADGTVYESAGEAVRGQVSDLKSDLSYKADKYHIEEFKVTAGKTAYGIGDIGLGGIGKVVDNPAYSCVELNTEQFEHFSIQNANEIDGLIFYNSEIKTEENCIGALSNTETDVIDITTPKGCKSMIIALKRESGLTVLKAYRELFDSRKDIPFIKYPYEYIKIADYSNANGWGAGVTGEIVRDNNSYYGHVMVPCNAGEEYVFQYTNYFNNVVYYSDSIPSPSTYVGYELDGVTRFTIPNGASYMCINLQQANNLLFTLFRVLGINEIASLVPYENRTTGKRIVTPYYDKTFGGISVEDSSWCNENNWNIANSVVSDIPYLTDTFGHKYTVLFAPGETEKVVYSKNGSGMIYYMQFIGSNAPDASEELFHQTIEVYTDGFLYFRGKLFELAGFDTENLTKADFDNVDFSTNLFAKKCSIYSHVELKYKIPFYQNVSVKLIKAERFRDVRCTQFVTIKVSDTINIEYNGVHIPYGAYLHSDKVLVESLGAGEQIEFLNTNKNGMVLSHSVFANSTNPNYIEGCVRAFLGGDEVNYKLISTGLEDYFSMPYGWYVGAKQYIDSGATFASIIQPHEGKYIVSTYRNFDNEPCFFKSGGFKLTGRNCDQNSGLMDLNSTENLANWGAGNAPVRFGSQITYYEWD